MAKKLSKDFLKGLEDSLLIGSTLVEGSTLSENEARQVLQGRTVTGHPVREFRELLNYRSGVEWLVKALDAAPFLSEDLILGFHEKLFVGFNTRSGTYKIHKNYCFQSSGQKHWYSDPSLVSSEMKNWIEDFNKPPASPKQIAPRLAQLYNDFEQIHPFEDGNGRMGRIFIAIYGFVHAHKKFSFFAKDRIEHLEAMEKANRGDLSPLIQFIEKRLR